LIDAMGGSIQIIMDKNKGTGLIVYLSLDIPQQTSEKKTDSHLKYVGSPGLTKILAVDDNEVNLFYLENLFESNNFKIKTVTNGLDCLNILKKESFDIILMDIQMPGLTSSKTLYKGIFIKYYFGA
jgi:hypothetical protein